MKKKNKPTAFEADLADKLKDAKFASAYIMSAIADHDLNFLPVALGDVAKARGISRFAKETGIHRRTLYKIFDKEGNPSFEVVSRVVESLGLEIQVKPKRFKKVSGS